MNELVQEFVQRKEVTKMHELVQVMVPRRFLVDVYALIAELESKAESEEDLSDGSEEAENKEWTPELIRRMYVESPPGMMRALNYMMDHPDRWIPAPEVTHAIEPGRDSRRLGGTLGAFGRRVKNRYGMDTWPFWVEWDHEAKQVRYWMDGEVAEQLRKYRRSA